MKLSASEIEEIIKTKIPITSNLEFSINSIDESGISLLAELEKHKNHHGTAFGGSLTMLSIIATYSMAFVLLQEYQDEFKKKAHLVIRRNNSEFNSPVESDFIANCPYPDNESKESLFNSLNRRGKGRITLSCNILDSFTFSAVFVCFLDQP